MKKFLCIIVSLILLLAFTNLSAKMEWVKILNNIEDGVKRYAWKEMDFINDSVGVVLVSDAGLTRLDKTTDAGLSWHTIYDERSEGVWQFSFDIEFLDNGDILIAYEKGIIKNIKNYYSEGEKDSIVLGEYIDGVFKPVYRVSSIQMLNNNIGIASTGAFLFYTDDCWQTYKIISPDKDFYSGGKVSPWIFSPDTIAFVGGDLYTSYYFLTTDQGKTWTKNFIAEYDVNYYSLGKSYFFDTKTGFLVGGVYTGSGHIYYDIILKTTDAGKNWRIVQFGSGNGKFGYVQDIDFKDRMTGMAVAQYGTIIKTSDGGDNWEYEERIDWGGNTKEGPWGMYVAYASDTPIISTVDYGLWRWQDSELMGVTDTRTHNIKSYPNPFDDYVNIEFPPALYGKQAQIQILDVAGTIIEQGNFEIQQGGLVFRNEDLTPGTYFCRVITLQNVYTIKLIKK